MRITLILLLILYAVKAHGAEDYVLFVDMNNSAQEVKAARESVEKSGRKLVLLPDLSELDRKKFQRLNQDLNIARNQYIKNCMGDKVDKKSCDEHNKKYYAADEAKSKFMEQIKVTKEKLGAFLEANKEKKFSSVVISGHDGTGSFSGEFGSISDSAVASELGKYPAIKDSIRALHLWGCYTTSPGSLLINWKKHFPNTSLITGYEGRAPLNDKPAGWHYLKGVLAQEPQLVRAGDSAKLQKLLKKIPGANQVTSAIYACDEYASLKDNYNIADLQHRCDDIKPQIEAQGPEFECYLKANEEKCSNPPEDVGRGPVRQFYELLHKGSACGEITEDPIFITYSRDTAIRLVFSRELQKNFGQIYAQLLGEVDDQLAKLGAPERLRFKDVASLSRREAMQRADELLAFLEKMKEDPFQDPAHFKIAEHHAELAALREFQESFTRVFTELSPNCVPFNWTEPNQKERSSCMRESWIGKGGVKKLLEPEGRLRPNTLSGMAYDLDNQITQMEKSAGKNPDAATQAKIEEYSAQAEKLRYYSRYEEGKVPDGHLERVKKREEYAAMLKALAQKGVDQPKLDPGAMHLMLEINRPEVLETINGHKAELLRYQGMLKNGGGSSDSDRVYFENQIKSQEASLRNEQAVIEYSDLIASPAEGDGLMAKTKRLNEIRDELGKSLFNTEKNSKEDEIKSYASYLQRTDLSADAIEQYKEDLKEAEEMLRILNTETAADMRLRGQNYLLKLRNKY